MRPPRSRMGPALAMLVSGFSEKGTPRCRPQLLGHAQPLTDLGVRAQPRGVATDRLDRGVAGRERAAGRAERDDLPARVEQRLHGRTRARRGRQRRAEHRGEHHDVVGAGAQRVLARFAGRREPRNAAVLGAAREPIDPENPDRAATGAQRRERGQVLDLAGRRPSSTSAARSPFASDSICPL